ncbi:MAG: DegV family EDD domain-containing protein [Deltaproteobacteria bacterium]|nr:DegV family EDD domain-containing protein [Deltaproteobacteria bacterium]
MDRELGQALVTGAERLAGWADLLDRLNVFPVPDGDTGRNLVLSLSPLRRYMDGPAAVPERLLLAARGNSGNIAARFFSGFLTAAGADDLPAAAAHGNDLAWKAVPDPRPGTMLSLFEQLRSALAEVPPGSSEDWIDQVLDRLEAAVRATTDQLPKLKAAGVVDSGALGMFVFFDGFFHSLVGRAGEGRNLSDAFAGRLRLDAGWQAAEEDESEPECCIDAVLAADTVPDDFEEQLAELGESIVSVREGGYVKVHLHAGDETAARARLGLLGKLVSFSSDDLRQQTGRFAAAAPETSIHVLTDAAGSVTRGDAAELGMTLLDSYVNLSDRSVPETHLPAEELYAAMRAGMSVSTSQASVYERHQHYARVLEQHPRVLYVCVGSVFTGNFRTASDWKAEHDRDGRMLVLDSGAASGRLGLAAIATARIARSGASADEVVRYARRAVEACREYVFLDKLHWLAAGGRLSKTKAFFGDMLSKKPVVSPLPDGARKMAVLKCRDEQVAYAEARVREFVPVDCPHLLMLEHTDNEDWVRDVPARLLAALRPDAEVLVRRMSLTSGVHMGPGTWGIAMLPVALPVTELGSARSPEEVCK